LIKCSMSRSTMRRATHCRSSRCGIVPFGARLLTEVAAHSGETEKPYPERVMARRCEASQRAILLWRRERFPAAVAIFPSKSNRSVNQKVGENPKSKHVCLLRRVSNLCRARHKFDNAELRIIPSWQTRRPCG